jgi:hypothetical protein
MVKRSGRLSVVRMQRVRNPDVETSREFSNETAILGAIYDKLQDIENRLKSKK